MMAESEGIFCNLSSAALLYTIQYMLDYFRGRFLLSSELCSMEIHLLTVFALFYALDYIAYYVGIL